MFSSVLAEIELTEMRGGGNEATLPFGFKGVLVNGPRITRS